MVKLSVVQIKNAKTGLVKKFKINQVGLEFERMPNVGDPLNSEIIIGVQQGFHWSIIEYHTRNLIITANVEYLS